jgi:transposase-like protein
MRRGIPSAPARRGMMLTGGCPHPVTSLASSIIMPWSAHAPGASRFPGAVVMRPRRGDGLLTTAEAARLVGVQPVTIRQWRNRGHLVAQGLDEQNRPLHTREAVRAAEKRVRENGLQASGIDPRQLRGRSGNLAA